MGDENFRDESFRVAGFDNREKRIAAKLSEPGTYMYVVKLCDDDRAQLDRIEAMLKELTQQLA